MRPIHHALAASLIAILAAAPIDDAVANPATTVAAAPQPATVLGFALKTGVRLSFGINKLPAPTIRELSGGVELRFEGAGPMKLPDIAKLRRITALDQRTDGNATVVTISYACACRLSTSRSGKSFRIDILERPGQPAPQPPVASTSARADQGTATPTPTTATPTTATSASAGLSTTPGPARSGLDTNALRIDLTERLVQFNSLTAPPGRPAAGPVAEAAPPARKTCPPAFSMDGWKGSGPYAARLLALRAAAARSEEAAPEMATLAEFLLGHGLAAEALSIARQARIDRATDAERARLERIADVASLLRGMAIDTRSPLLTDPPDCDRLDTPLWRALSAAATADVEGVTKQIEAARQPLSHLPEPLLQMFAARLVETAPEDPTVLRAVASAMRNTEIGGPEEASARYLLQSRLARSRGDTIDETAFLERAARGVTMPAMAARLRLAEIRAATDGPDAEHSALVLADAARTYRDTPLGQSAAYHLSERQMRQGNHAAALRTADESSAFRQTRRTESRGAAQAARVLRALLVDPDASNLPPPEERLVLYWKYRAYATPGERGDDIRMGAARLMLAQDMPEAALDVVRQLSESSARTPEGMRLRAMAEARAGDAEQALQMAMRLGDGDESRRVAAEALARGGRMVEAAQRLDGVGTLADQTRRAAWLYQAKDWPGAAEAFARVLRNPELTPEARVTAGDHYALALALAGQEPAEDLRGLTGMATRVLGALPAASPDPGADVVTALRGAVQRAGQIETLLQPTDGRSARPSNGRRGT